MSEGLAFINLDLVDSSRSLATTLLELAWLFEDLYVPDDPEEPINQALHDEVAQALYAAHIQLTDYVTRVHEATKGTG